MRLIKTKHLSDKIFGYTMLFYLIVICAITFWLVAETYRSARQGVLREGGRIERPKSAREGQVLLGRDVLIAEENNAVFGIGTVNVLEDLSVDVESQVNAGDLGSQWGFAGPDVKLSSSHVGSLQ